LARDAHVLKFLRPRDRSQFGAEGRFGDRAGGHRDGKRERCSDFVPLGDCPKALRFDFRWAVSLVDKELFEKALQMPPNDRLTFAELILASIEFEEDEIRNAWIEEVRDRMKAATEGRANLLDFIRLYHAGYDS
jgi:hypothetical protein